MTPFRPLLVAAVAIALGGPAILPAQADTTTTVRFQAGGDHASYSGSIRGDETARYFIDARAGQQLRVSFDSDNAGAYFNVLPAGSQQAMFNGATSGNRFSGLLPRTGRYVIEVYLVRAAARRGEVADYSVDIAIPAAKVPAPEPDYADGNAGGPDRWEVRGVAAGDRLNVRTAPAPDAALVGRLRNGDVVRNLGCRQIGSSRWCRVSAPGEGGVHGWTNGRFLVEASGRGYGGNYEDSGAADGAVRDAKCKDSPRDCVRKAENKCNGEFRTLHSESHAGGVLDDKVPGPVTWFYLEYQCGYSDGRMPQFPFRGAHYQREYAPGDDFSSDGGYGRQIDKSAMRDTCRAAAAMAFNTRTKHVELFPVERTANGYSMDGQYMHDGVENGFSCTFGADGIFRRVYRY